MVTVWRESAAAVLIRRVRYENVGYFNKGTGRDIVAPTP